jgi:hypothetical protein
MGRDMEPKLIEITFTPSRVHKIRVWLAGRCWRVVRWLHPIPCELEKEISDKYIKRKEELENLVQMINDAALVSVFGDTSRGGK